MLFFVCQFIHLFYLGNFVSNSRFTRNLSNFIINIFIIFCISQYLPSISHIIHLIINHYYFIFNYISSVNSVSSYIYLLFMFYNTSNLKIKSLSCIPLCINRNILISARSALTNNQVALLSSMPTRCYIYCDYVPP